jgi:hypothetical protein
MPRNTFEMKKAYLCAILTLGVLSAAAEAAPSPTEFSAAQTWADRLLKSNGDGDIAAAKVTWDQNWTCQISLNGTNFTLTAVDPDPHQACYSALLRRKDFENFVRY